MTAIGVASDLALEPIQPADAIPLFALIQANRLHLRRWLSWVDANTELEHTRSFIESARKQAADNLGPTYAVCVKGAIGGVIGYHPVDWRNRSASFGYWLAEPLTGHGIMTSACRALLGHAFHTLELNRLSISAAVDNTPSRAIAERLGFKQTALIQEAELLHGRYVDHVVYTLRRDEWAP